VRREVLANYPWDSKMCHLAAFSADTGVSGWVADGVARRQGVLAARPK
jgi:hypothetical protein